MADQLESMEVGELFKLKDHLLEKAKVEQNKLEYMKVMKELHKVMKEIEGRWIYE